MRAAIDDLVYSAFKVRPEELSRAALAFATLFTAVGAFIVGRITRTVLFLEIPDYKAQLPLMYVLIAATVALAMTAYARVERKLRRDHTSAITLGVIIVVTLGFRYALAGGRHSVYWAFYIWVELYGSFVILQFWALANDIFNARQAKRLFAVIGGGGVLANVVLGFAVSGWVKTLGTENLMFVMSALLALALAGVLLLGRAARPELATAQGRGPGVRPKGPSGRIFESRHVRLIAAVVVVVYLVSTLVDYQFQVIVGDAIAGKDERSAFIGTFFGVTGILAAVIQFFFTSRILERFGILVALSLLPLAMMTGSAGLALAPLVPALLAVSATKGAENVLRYTINDSTLQLFYLPLPTHIRGRVKTVIDGILKPLAIGGAGLLMAVLVGQLEELTGIGLGFRLGAGELSWVVVLALGAWLVALVQLRKEYLSSLLRTLQRRRLNFAESRFEIGDDSTLRTLARALESRDEGEVLHALELARLVTPRAQSPLHERVASLLGHPSDEVRVAALKVLGQGAHAERVGELLGDASPAVRVAATLAHCAMLRERALAGVQPLLEDPAPEVRAAAVAGLIRYGGLDGVLASADTLKQMLGSPAAAERRRAAWVLGEVGVQTFFQPLVPLFEDADESVRLAAIVAAGALKSPHLVDALVRQLAHARHAGAAATALAAYGPGIGETIAAILADQGRDPALRASACKVLSRVGDARAVELLHAHLADADAAVRGAAIGALTMVVNHDSSVRIDRTLVRTALMAETRHAVELLALAQDLALDARAVLLQDAIGHRQEQAQQRIFGLLALEYPADTIELVSRNLQSSQAATRANAVEVLDNLLDGEEKAFVVPLVEEAPAEKKLDLLEGSIPVARGSRRRRLEELLAGADPWLRVCAAMAVAAWGLKALEERVRRLLESESALCREAAIVALRQLGEASTLRPALERLRGDEALAVSRYAEHVLAEIA